MKTLAYQSKAVREVVEKTLDMLGRDRTRQKLVFQAPTGSGKTVMATMAMERIAKTTRGHANEPVMIWIAPNSLHEQSYFSMKNYFSETRDLRPVMYDELDHAEGLLHPGEVLFANWESINKDKNRIVRDSEQGCSLFEMTRRTREAGHPIIVIIDEEHEFWSATADKSKQVLDKIDPKVELRISATPKTTNPDQWVKIDRSDVIREEMIKEGIVLNPDIRQGISEERELTQHLIDVAMRKRKEISDAYKRLGVNINPLLLIQLPNDNSATLTKDEEKLIETIWSYLEATSWNLSIDNGRLAVWLSGNDNKKNLDGIEQPTSMVDALLFKQAIAKGWDCPRAAVLLIFRRMNSFEFTMQTVGRILRMPEQHFYSEPLLNKGYVYTDVSKEQIAIVQDGIGYISRLMAKRRNDVEPITLYGKGGSRPSESRNRLGSDFREVLRKTMIDQWRLAQTRLYFDDNDDANLFPTGQDSVYGVNRQRAEANGGITFDVKQIQIEIAENVDLNLTSETNGEYITDLEGHRMGYARRGGELRKLFEEFCSRNIGQFEKSASAPTLGRCLMELMEELFECDENQAIKVILSTKRDNNKKFAEVVRKALTAYEHRMGERKQRAAERSIVDVEWHLPDERIYDEATNTEIDKVENHALQPFIQLNKASTPEKEFVQMLEANSEHIAWWYKNGDKGRDHYAIDYVKGDGSRALFYVDFIVCMKSGRLMLLDTKSANSDPDAPAKHNALIDYLQQHDNMGGGIIIKDNATGNWLYSDTYIDNTSDHSGWRAFFPDQEQ